MPVWLLVGYLLLVPTFSKTKSCEGPQRNAIQAVLSGEHVDWEILADQLNLTNKVAAIQGKCSSRIDIRPCYFREIVSRYIQSQPDESCDNTRRKIVTALEKLDYVYEASQLRRLILDSPPNGRLDHSDDDSSNETPSTIPDEAVKTTRGLIKELENEFHTIVLIAPEDMKENEVDCGKLRLSLVNLPVDLKNKLDYYKKEIKDNLIAATSVDDIFFNISDYWDFLNYFLLEHIIDQHASEKVREKMTKYVEKIRVFKRNTTLQIFSKAHERIPRKVDKQLRQMVTEHKIDCATATLEDIDNFRNDINNEHFLSTFALLVFSVTCGSVEITWLVPESLVALIQKSIKPSSPFMRNHNVTKLTIDGVIVYDNATENQISSESSTVEPIKQLISPAISILVSVLIVVLTTLYIYLMDFEQSPVQPDKRQELEQPSLQQLLHHNIPQHVGPHYFEFGVLLLNDHRGSRVRCLEYDCQRDVVRIVSKILQDWLDKKGVPVTWKSLIEVLRHIELSVLADQIEQASQQKETETQLPFGVPGKLLDEPTLPELVCLKIHKYVAINCFEFGVLLLNDHIGSRVRCLEYECQRDVVRIVLKILEDWLNGNGVPVTWKSLIEVLRHIEFIALADQIEQASQQKEMETQLPFGGPGKLLDGPTLPELLCLEVHQHVGHHYLEFGIFLLNNITCVEYLKRDCHGSPVRIVLGILQEWLEGKGKPITWESLVMVLRSIRLPELADQIVTKTQISIKPVPERPTLPQLLHLKILQHVCDHNFEFGVHLLNDHKGNRIKRLKECLEDPEDVALMILQDWVKGKGVPVTWESLTEAVRHIDQALADQISQQKETMTQPIKRQSPLAGPSQPATEEDSYEYMEEEAKRHFCPICHKVVHNPYHVPCCGSNYCYDCIMNPGIKVKEAQCPRQSSHESKFIRVCSKCRGEFCENCMEKNVALQNELKEYKVKCRYYEKGCKWVGLQQYSDEHEQEECRHVQNPKLTEERRDIVPVKRILHNFSEMKEDYYKLDPFYTHDGGYKMHLWVIPNGYRKEEGKYMSVFTCLVKGENDDKLKWPLRGSITVQLLDQSGKGNHLERTFHYCNTEPYDNTYYGRVTHSGRSEGVWPDKPFLAREALFGKSCDYLRNDCLKFRISKCKVQTSWRKIIAFVVVIFLIFIFSYFSYFTN